MHPGSGVCDRSDLPRSETVRLPTANQGRLEPNQPKRCVYCSDPVNDRHPKHDLYGEHMLGGELLVCDTCHEDFQHEDGPWNEVQ